MIRLSREIRFSMFDAPESPVTNSWSGWPSTNQLVPWLIMRCAVDGTPDEKTGYVCNVKTLDHALRDVVTQHLIPNYQPTDTAEQLTRTAFDRLNETWNDENQIVYVQLAVSPFLKFTIYSSSPSMLTLTQQFEFSAAHRLNCDQFSADENKEVFGKCNNPEGHGHNYVVEVSVQADSPMGDTGQLIELDEFQRTVKRLIVDRLDHKHLNRDVEYFKNVNPSVENIAIAIWNWLEGQLGKANLSAVKVYETPKTWAEFRGGK